MRRDDAEGVCVMGLRALMTGAAMALAMTTSTAFAEGPPYSVSSITVQANVTAIASEAAADFWRDLPTDLEDALARELVGSLDPEGLALLVAVDELALAEAFELGFSDDARLAGRVQLVDPSDDSVERTYEVSAAAREAELLLPPDVEVATISRTSGEFYEAVVGAFARGVADTVRGGT
jgi:hypothetical protein